MMNRRRTCSAHAAGRPQVSRLRIVRSWSRRRRVLLAVGTIVVAACAAIVVPSVVLGRGAGPLATAAWAVQRNSDGTIKVTMRQARDAAGLQSALRADGILAYVRYTPWVTKQQGNTITGQPAETCEQAGGPAVPGKIVEAVFPFPAGGAPNQGYAVTINPAAIPRDDAILIQVAWGSEGSGGDTIDVQDGVMGTGQPPVCSPNG